MIKKILFFTLLGLFGCNNNSKIDIDGNWKVVAKSSTVGVSDIQFKNGMIIYSFENEFKDSSIYNLKNNILIIQRESNSPDSMELSFSNDTMVLKEKYEGKTISYGNILKLLKITKENIEDLSSFEPKIIQEKKKLKDKNIPKRKIKYSVKTNSNIGGFQIIFNNNDNALSEKVLQNNWIYEFQGDSGKCFLITHISLLDENGGYDVSERSKKVTINTETYIDDSLVSKVNIRNDEFFVVIDKNYDCKKKE